MDCGAVAKLGGVLIATNDRYFSQRLEIEAFQRYHHDSTPEPLE